MKSAGLAVFSSSRDFCHTHFSLFKAFSPLKTAFIALFFLQSKNKYYLLIIKGLDATQNFKKDNCTIYGSSVTGELLITFEHQVLIVI